MPLKAFCLCRATLYPLRKFKAFLAYLRASQSCNPAFEAINVYRHKKIPSFLRGSKKLAVKNLFQVLSAHLRRCRILLLMKEAPH